MSNDKFSSTSSARREERQPSSTQQHQPTAPSSSSSSSATATRAKQEKKQPVFGRPLVPYFLDDNPANDGELLINEQLELPEKLQALQKDLIVPNGNRDITVREFRDGYFEHKQLDLDNVLQSQHEVPNFVSGASGNSKGKDLETFSTLNSTAQLNKRASPAQKKKLEQMKHFDNYFNMVVKRADPTAQVNPVLAEAGISLDSNGTIHHENGLANGFSKPPRTNLKSGQQSQTPQKKPRRSSPSESTFKRERTSPTQFRMSPVSSPSIATPEASRIEPPKLITPQYILATANKNFAISGNSKHAISQPSPFIGTYKVIEEGSSSDEYSDEDILPNNGYKTPSPPETARQLTYTPVRPGGAETFHSSASPFNTHLPPTHPHSMQPPRIQVPLATIMPPPVPESSPVVPYPHVASELTEAQLLESLQQLSAPSSSSSKLNPAALKKTAAAASASHTPHAGGAWSNSPPASSLPIIPESWRKRLQ